MAFALKRYQQRSLDELRRFLRRASEAGAATAFTEQTGLAYRSVVEVPGMPYVCLRVPTGGGKTLMAAHAVGVARVELLRAERAMVLWLAPTTAIVEQTLAGLRDRRHPYRRALEEGAGGPVEVVDMDGALALNRGTVAGATVVIVGTLQALRVERTEGRRVYEANGELQAHFSGLGADELRGLERFGDDGPVVYSLANLMRLRRPVVIMDEAHNARTQLSFETLGRLGPACVVEFTATPAQGRQGSNVLSSVSAAELKAEDMVKLPVRLESREQWREAVQAALGKQAELERVAREEEEETGEYLRPIVLFQAQSRAAEGERITVEILRKALVEEFGVPAEQIAEGTGEKWELPENLAARDCPVRFVLTVAKLREGWDCPFAYILCSVANLSGATAVEQVLGRVLRLPGARAKQRAELNRAYAFATSARFRESANTLVDALVESGFERFEARAEIEAEQPWLEPGPLFAEAVEEVFAEPIDLGRAPEELRPHLEMHVAPTAVEGLPPRYRVTYHGRPITAAEASALAACAAPEDVGAVERLRLKSMGRASCPAARGVSLEVPQLTVVRGEQRELFERPFEGLDWRLSVCDPELSELEFSSDDPLTQAAELDLRASGRIEPQFVQELQRQLGLEDSFGPKTAIGLALWLDQNIKHDDVVQMESSLFLLRMVEWLESRRGFSLERLASARYRLREAAAAKIEEHRRRAEREAFQRLLGGGVAGAEVRTSPEACFRYPAAQYPAARFFQGRLGFGKHYYERPGEMNGEEAECALALDMLPEVEVWVRNLERQPECSFWLQTPTDKFYPDFVARLRDGRLLVVEYKGEDRITNDDSKEKEALGALWAARSGGRCMFRMVGKRDMASALRQAVAAGSAAVGG